MGYIEFYTKEMVHAAVAINKTDFWGKIIEVTGCERHAAAEAMAAATAVTTHTSTMASARPLSQAPSKIYVGNLHPGVTEDMLRQLFSIFGEIEWIKLMRDQSGVSEGFAFINYRYAEDSKYAQQDLQGKEVGGRPLVIGYVAEESAGRRGEAMIAEAQLTAQQPPMLPEPSMIGMMDLLPIGHGMEDNDRLDDEGTHSICHCSV